MAARRPGWLLSAAIHVNSRSKFEVGHGNASNDGWEVIEILPDGKHRPLLVGISKDKATAIVVILNSPE